MKGKIGEQLFSLSAIAIGVGVAGFLSALVTMFINTSEMISIKWIIFLIWIFSSISVILLKYINDLSKENEQASPIYYAKPFKIEIDGKILLVKRNNLFINQSVVGCYLIDNEIESLMYIAQVNHIQEKFMQVKIIHDVSTKEQKKSLSSRGHDSLIIRPNISLEIFLRLGVNPNEQ